NNLIANEYNKLKAIYEYFQLIILDEYKNKYEIASQEAANKVYIKPKSDKKRTIRNWANTWLENNVSFPISKQGKHPKKNSLIENLEIKKQVEDWIDSQG
ncbi:15252_t:CDS:1, partial [Racocetra fulgida]